MDLTTPGHGSVALGPAAVATGYNSIAIGYSNTATGVVVPWSPSNIYNTIPKYKLKDYHKYPEKTKVLDREVLIGYTTKISEDDKYYYFLNDRNDGYRCKKKHMTTLELNSIIEQVYKGDIIYERYKNLENTVDKLTAHVKALMIASGSLSFDDNEEFP